MDWKIHTASEDWLVSYVHQKREELGIIGGLEEGDQVVQLSEKIVVKFGFGVSAQEAINQEFAYQHVDQSIIRVPRVYRFFVDSSSGFFPCGYLFMEHVSGWPLADLDLNTHTDIVQRVSHVVAHLNTISAVTKAPGPVGGGRAQGYIWGDDGARVTFHSVEDLDTWLNKRLAMQEKSIDITSYPLVFCHMDLCRRNIIMLADRSMCLIDFGHAGFFPRFFEIAALRRLNPPDDEYREPLIQETSRMMNLSEEETKFLSLLDRAVAVNLRFPDAFEKSEDNLYVLPEPPALPPPLPGLPPPDLSTSQPPPPSSEPIPPLPSPPREPCRPPPRGPPPPPPGDTSTTA